jgi:hypothetical protein
MIAPRHGGITRNCEFDLVVHFHGHEAVRKEFVKTAKGPVLVGFDLGIGSGVYESGFADPQRFERMLDSIEGAMAKKYNKPSCSVRKLAISSWSAGYGAVYRILTQPAGRKVDAVILLDSLHAGYANEQTHALKTEQLEPFVAFAKQAAARRKFMFLSHSSIIPPGYASTTEVAKYLVGQLGGRERRTHRQDVLGLDLLASFDRGNFHVRGYGGNDKPDHCAHLGLMAGIVKNYLQPRWHGPPATAR